MLDSNFSINQGSWSSAARVFVGKTLTVCSSGVTASGGDVFLGDFSMEKSAILR